MEKRAKNVELAIEEALKELNTTKENVNIKIIDEGSKGFLGIGAKDAVVEVTLKEVKKEVKPEQKNKNEKTTTSPVKTSRKRREGIPEEEAKKFLNGIFEAMKLNVEVSARLENDTVYIELTGDNMGIVIGKRGDTLDSLQYLTSLVVNKYSEDYLKVTIDTENYREKRTEALLALSTRLAEKVERTGRRFTLEPMNPYERRIIHSNLQDSESVTTYSVGQEPYRKVVIAPKNPKPHYSSKRPVHHKPKKAEYNVADTNNENVTAEKTGSYTTTYKADFKPQQHKAQYASYEEYLAAQENK